MSTSVMMVKKVTIRRWLCRYFVIQKCPVAKIRYRAAALGKAMGSFENSSLFETSGNGNFQFPQHDCT